MDYILEEMERQRQAMERLLSPSSLGREAAEEDELPQTVPLRAEETDSPWVSLRGAVARRARLRRGAAADPMQLSGNGVAAPEAAALRGGMTGRGGQSLREAAYRRRDGEAAAEAAELSYRLLPVRTESQTIRQAAQEVSRAVEREARRYDGVLETD